MQIKDIEEEKGKRWQGNESGWRIYYSLFSRSGFTQPLLDRANADPEILLFDPAMVISPEAHRQILGAVSLQ